MLDSPSSELQVEEVSPHIIRDMFNTGRFTERAACRDIRMNVLDYNNHLTRREREKMNRDPRTQVRFTKCTRSQMVLYSAQDGKRLALAHRYLRPDGQLAGSGMVNPHKLFLRDRIVAAYRE